MLLTAATVLAVSALAALVLQGLAAWSAHKHLGQRRPADLAAFPPVSLLKPVKGMEDGLEENLRSFFEQDYPAAFELVFASTDPDDIAMLVARRVAHQYPKVPSRFVRADASFGMNPKVANLKGALDAAAYDLVLQSDANVRVAPDYLRRIVTEFEAADAKLLSSVVVGAGERSLGATLENLQLTAFIAPGMCTALHIVGETCVVGKSMLFRRTVLESVGGLERVRDILCEDFILGRAFKEAGLKVVLSPTPVININEDIPVERFLSRHSRWLKMRAVIHVPSFVLDLFANPVALLFFAWLLSGFDARFGFVILLAATLKTALDSHYVRLFRGTPMLIEHLIASPLKDVLMGIVWIYAAFSRSVCWRGQTLRFGRESRLYAGEERPLPRLVRKWLARGRLAASRAA
jgi:ceramide glucosyltransferase